MTDLVLDTLIIFHPCIAGSIFFEMDADCFLYSTLFAHIPS